VLLLLLIDLRLCLFGSWMMSDEQTPLLRPAAAEKAKGSSAVLRILFCAFTISLSIAFTWVPYVFKSHLADMANTL